MSVTHTNRRGVTFYLRRGVTKTGKPRYFFAREPDKGEPVEATRKGYEIVESVNGVVSLAQVRPDSDPGSEELALVQAAVAEHPKAYNYRCRCQGRTHRGLPAHRRGPGQDDSAFHGLRHVPRAGR